MIADADIHEAAAVFPIVGLPADTRGIRHLGNDAVLPRRERLHPAGVLLGISGHRKNVCPVVDVLPVEILPPNGRNR